MSNTISFDESFYLSQNPDVAAAVSRGVFASGAQHFQLNGRFEGRNPNAFFNTSFYLGQYPDVARAGINPLTHFINFGSAEGRFANATEKAAIDLNNNGGADDFNNAKYLADYKDVADAVAAGTFKNGYQHFVQFGQFEARIGTLSNGTTITGPFSNTGVAPGVGTTFTLTTGLDALNGTNGNDTFIGSFDGAATSTSNLGDTINGGAGIDTVRIVSNAAATVVPTLTNVENLVIVDTVQESRDVSGIAGLTSLTLEGGTTIAGVGTVTATINASQSLTLRGITDGTPGADAAGTSDIAIATAAGITSVALNLEGVGAQTALSNLNDLDLDVTGTSVTTLNVTSTGTNNISLANTGGAITTVNVSGAGSTTIQGTTATTITTFDASKATGAVTADLSASVGANQTVTGGSGNDSFTVDLARNITLNAGAGNDLVTLANATAANLTSTAGAADSIKGGAGTDTLALTAAGAVALAGDTVADRAVISEFEQLRVTDDLNGSTFDISNFGVNYLQVGADLTTANATVNGFTSGATIEFRDANATAATQFALNIGVTGATNAGTPNDTINLVLNDDLVNQATAGAADGQSIQIEVGVAGINKLNVSTADRDNTDGATSRDDGYTLTLTNDNAVDTITVTGTNELSFTSTASTAALATFNASALTGDLIVNLGTNGLTQGVVVTGGAGTNTLTGTGFADTLVGGARADTITGGVGADTMTGGAGADTFVFANTSTGTPTATNFDTITDFGKASDIIDFGATNISFTAGGTGASGQASINASGIATFNAADNTLALRIVAVESAIAATGGAAVAGETAIFEFGSDSYVFVSDATGGVGATDVLIKLTGVTGLTTGTITGGDLTIA